MVCFGQILFGSGLILAAAEPISKPQASGRLIALGAVDGFGSLSQDGDAECLMSGRDEPSSGLFNASARFVSLLDSLGFGAKEPTKHRPVSSEMLASLVGSLQALIELEGSLAALCLSRDTLLRLRQASDALLALQEEDGRLMLQELEIQDDLDVACQDFKLKEYASFGRDLGQIWRRALQKAPPTPHKEHHSSMAGSHLSSSMSLKATAALLQSFFGAGVAGSKADHHSAFLWEDPLLFSTCVAQMSELQALWLSIGTVLSQRKSVHTKLWSFSTPDAHVKKHELQELAHLGEILGQLPRMVDACGLRGKEQHMFQQSLSVFKSPPERILSAAASSLFVLQEHWKDNAWQEVGSKLGLLMQDMLLDAFPKTFHMDGGRLKPQAQRRKGADTHVIILCLLAGLAIPVTGFAAARGWNVPRIIRAMFEIRKIRCDDCEEGSGNAVTEEIQIEFSARIRRLEMSGLLANDEEETIEDFQESMKIPYSAARRQV